MESDTVSGCECGSLSVALYGSGEMCDSMDASELVWAVPGYLQATAQVAHGGFDDRLAEGYWVDPECLEGFVPSEWIEVE